MRAVGRVGGIALVMATAWATAVTGAVADPGEATHVDELAAVVDGDTIRVTGLATFVDVPAVIGEDVTGDAVPDGGELAFGHDLTTATIGRPDPFGETLTFTLTVANQSSTVSGVPEAVLYRWPVQVDSAEPIFTLEAFADSLGGCPDNPGIGPCFRVMHYTGMISAVRTGDLLAEVPGAMAAGVVQWQVPMSVFNVQPGSAITPAGVAEVVLGVGGPGMSFPHPVTVALDRVSVQQQYQIPAPAVRVGIAPIGTPEADMMLTAAAALEDDGAFSAEVAAPGSPGDYMVVTEACYGTATCARAATTVTLA